jgi:ubiquinone/menaquinone biosynthesis C-methylase UbiE
MTIDDEIMLPNFSLSVDSQRKQEEEEFHDHSRAGTDVRPNRRFYAISGVNQEANRNILRPILAKGGRVLDYGCGNGDFAIWAAQQGALVSAIDISAVSIENARHAAEDAAVADRISFRVMDAEHMGFEDNSFDAICILGVLHHLDLDAAYRELVRVVKATGTVVATEATRHNPIIHAYRKRTPHLRTDWELHHILGKPDVDLARQYFRAVDVQHFHLAALAAIPLRQTKLFEPSLKTLTAFDQKALLKIPGLRWWAWMTLFTMREPMKAN